MVNTKHAKLIWYVWLGSSVEEHWSLNLRVRGSNPGRSRANVFFVFFVFFVFYFFFCCCSFLFFCFAVILAYFRRLFTNTFLGNDSSIVTQSLKMKKKMPKIFRNHPLNVKIFQNISCYWNSKKEPKYYVQKWYVINM